MRLSKSLAIIALSALSICGPTHLLLRAHTKKLHARHHNPNYNISLIIQTGPEKNALPTSYLAELIGLSLDQPTNLYTFHAKAAEKALLASPLITHATIKPVKPSSLYIDYTVRRPIFRLAEYPNTGVDSSGHLFPLNLLTPKNLPELILSESLTPPIWGQTIDMTLLNQLLQEITLPITRLDLTDAYAKSIGRRQITLISNNHILRLPMKNMEKSLAQYQQLQLPPGPQTIDLRLENLAFIDN